jgi:hypothetical protein
MTLTGNRCQCAACGRYFSRTSVFDKHRTGDFGKDRRCMTDDEMQQKGLRIVGGLWRGKPRAE